MRRRAAAAPTQTPERLGWRSGVTGGAPGPQGGWWRGGYWDATAVTAACRQAQPAEMPAGRQSVLRPQVVLQAAALDRVAKLPALHDPVATGKVERQLWVRAQAARRQIAAAAQLRVVRRRARRQQRVTQRGSVAQPIAPRSPLGRWPRAHLV